MLEFLKELFGTTEDGQPVALTFEQLEAAAAQHKDTIKAVNLASGGYVAQGKYDADVKKEQTRAEGLQKQLDEANTTIKSLQDGAADIEAVKKAAKEWEEKYKTDTAALEEKMKAQDRSHQADMFLSGFKYTSKAAQAGIRAAFDQKEFKLVDGKFEGADEFMKSLMADDDYKGAFEVEKQPENDNPNGEGENGGQPEQPPAGKLPMFAAGTNGGGTAPEAQNPFGGFGFAHVRQKQD